MVKNKKVGNDKSVAKKHEKQILKLILNFR